MAVYDCGRRPTVLRRRRLNTNLQAVLRSGYEGDFVWAWKPPQSIGTPPDAS